MGFEDMRAAKKARGEDKHRTQPVHIHVSVSRRARAEFGDVYGQGRAVSRHNEGSPIFKDRFFIMEATPTDSVTIKGHEAKARRPHPDFVETAGKITRPRAFKILHCMVINANLKEWLDSRLAMWVAPNGRRLSNRRPWCASDDFKTATRWDEKAGAFYDLKCPYRDCQFYGAKDGCRPHTTAVFMLRHADDVPSNLIGRVSTKSPLTWELLEDFVSQVEAQMAGLGFGDNWHGIRFTMQVTEGTGEGRRWPMIEFKLDGPLDHALMDRYGVIAEIKRRQIAAGLPVSSAAGLLPPPTARELAEDWGETDDIELSGEALRPTSAPAAVMDAEFDEVEGAPDAKGTDDPLPAPGPPIPDAVDVAPDGSPVCWKCGTLMDLRRGRTGAGYTCGCGSYITPEGEQGWRAPKGSDEEGA